VIGYRSPILPVLKTLKIRKVGLPTFKRSREDGRVTAGVERKESPGGHEAQKRTDAKVSRLCLRIKPLKSLKRQEGYSERRVLNDSGRD